MQGRSRSDIGKESTVEAPGGFTAFGVFLFFGAAMASLAGTTLAWPGTALDRVWLLNPGAYRQLAPLGRVIGVAFLVLGMVMALAGVGWFRRRLWGWRLGVAIIAIQALGDLVNCLRGDFLRGGVGLAIAGGLLVYLLRPKLRASLQEAQRKTS